MSDHDIDPNGVTVRRLDADDVDAQREAAALLLEGFVEMAPEAWSDLEDALREVRDALGPERLCLAAKDADGRVAGWVGAIRNYDGNAWELHPLVVAPALQGRGIGRALVVALEEELRARGAMTVYLGTDDEAGMTSLGGADLYPGVLEKLAAMENRRGHPFTFYRRLGYEVVGCIPDANGFGKPDIFMAKRLGRADG
jgi:aminoglycoside 6'-N-acetyltransferase I